MSATAIPQEKSETRPSVKISWNGIRKNFFSPLLVTVFAAILLAIFLMPFLYMIFTSLEYSTQVSTPGAPIWPAKNPTYIYAGQNIQTYTLKVNKSGFVVNQAINMNDFKGQELGIYSVPLGNGVTKNLALLKGYQKSSIFIDPANPAADPIVWNGY